MADNRRRDPLSGKVGDETFLGFDFGNKKIGVAVGDKLTGLANPLKTLRSVNQTPDWTAIGHLVDEWQVNGFVVGISKQEDGTDNAITPRMIKFCRQLEGRYRLPVYRQDETLSTFEAKQFLFDEVKVKATRLWAVQDGLAAQLILQSWLNDTR